MLDSESSQSADLSRINGVEEEAETGIWANGEISRVMQGSRMVTINHQPVPEWDWPGMVMNFAEGLDMSDVQRGKAIDLRKTEVRAYEVVDYKVQQTQDRWRIWVTGDITMLMADFSMITVNISQSLSLELESG
ncbi:copper-binding protein [Vibrio chagasii]|nr:copper-binding protein [Vibrio chagasii]